MIEPEGRFGYTDHANAMLAERDIRSEWAERAILDPDATEAIPSTSIGQGHTKLCLSATAGFCVWYMSSQVKRIA